jgi:UDP-N-acetyl-D-glucosamine 4,6-dehydratase
LINESDKKTEFDSIQIAKPHKYDIEKLSKDIEELIGDADKLSRLRVIVPEFNHKTL